MEQIISYGKILLFFVRLRHKHVISYGIISNKPNLLLQNVTILKNRRSASWGELKNTLSEVHGISRSFSYQSMREQSEELTVLYQILSTFPL